mmetsp:Transcript_13000/g.23911  ORF Transcript_13000/g.23911 Transcript_13000/m.23911 type:complete len:253 (+) Transcript_13000:113-871(+)
MKSSFWSTSGAAALTSPIETLKGLVKMDPAKSQTAGGNVAENINVCTIPPCEPRGQYDIISSTCGANPMSSTLSASSSTICFILSSEMRPSRSTEANLSGVDIATSNLFSSCALLPDILSSTRADHFLPCVSLTNSSRVCFASSRVGSSTKTRANSLPGFSSIVSSGPKKAIVLPLPVGADASMCDPVRTAGKHCIWMAVGSSKPSFCMFCISQLGTPRSAMASNDAMGSGTPAPARMRCFLRKAITASADA